MTKSILKIHQSVRVKSVFTVSLIYGLISALNISIIMMVNSV